MRRQTRALGTKVYEVKYRQININIGSPGHRTSDVYVYGRMRVGVLMYFTMICAEIRFGWDYVATRVA